MKIIYTVIVAALLSSCGIRVTVDAPKAEEPKPAAYPKYFGTVEVDHSQVVTPREIHVVCIGGIEYYYMEFDGGLAPRYTNDAGYHPIRCTKP